jgi:hypothetical protein
MVVFQKWPNQENLTLAVSMQLLTFVALAEFFSQNFR